MSTEWTPDDERFVKLAAGLWDRWKRDYMKAVEPLVKSMPLPPVVAALPEVSKLMAAVSKHAFVWGVAQTMMTISTMGMEPDPANPVDSVILSSP